jgi:hypothetical protein
MLRALPKSLFSWNYAVLDGAQPVADIEISFWGERGRLQVQDVSYEVRREAWLGAFVLQAGGSVLARAEKPSPFLRSFAIHHEGRSYTLRARSPFERTFVLAHGQEAIGSVSPEGIFTRRARADLPLDLPLPLRVFMIWLALILWKRAANAAPAATAT